jgi:hypothetical protein
MDPLQNLIETWIMLLKKQFGKPFQLINVSSKKKDIAET